MKRFNRNLQLFSNPYKTQLASYSVIIVRWPLADLTPDRGNVPIKKSAKTINKPRGLPLNEHRSVNGTTVKVATSKLG